MKEPLTINALSRTSRGTDDVAVWVCSACGQDEAFEDAFEGFPTHANFWPMTRKYEHFLTTVADDE